jgi:hypothetical protein
MALATFALFYNNYDIFCKSGNKIRRGLAVKLMLEANDIEKVKSIYFNYAVEIHRRARSNFGKNKTDESFEKVSLACANVILA